MNSSDIRRSLSSMAPAWPTKETLVFNSFRARRCCEFTDPQSPRKLLQWPVLEFSISRQRPSVLPSGTLGSVRDPVASFASRS